VTGDLRGVTFERGGKKDPLLRGEASSPENLRRKKKRQKNVEWVKLLRSFSLHALERQREWVHGLIKEREAGRSRGR